MTISRRAGRSGATSNARVLAASTLWTLLAACTPNDAASESESTAAGDASTGMDIDPQVLEVFLETRYNKPASEATPAESSAARDQLLDIYALSEQPRAKELGETPYVKAQLELQRRGMLAQAVANDFLENNIATEEEMCALYDEQVKLAPLEFKARHILVETEEEGAAIIQELDDGGDFQELAKERSTGPSGPSGGDLGWFTPERMVPEFSIAVAALADGEYSKSPVESQFGWHVILREESRPSTPPPFESVGEVLKQQVEQRKLQDYLDGLRGEQEE